MSILAALDIAAILPLAIGILGLAGLVFTALRFRRDDTTAIVTQQSTILGNMKTLNDELRLSAENLRVERDKLAEEIVGLKGQIEALRVELREAMGKSA